MDADRIRDHVGRDDQDNADALPRVFLSWQEWYDDASSLADNRRQRLLLDVRERTNEHSVDPSSRRQQQPIPPPQQSETPYPRSKNVVLVHIPLSQLRARSFELPPRGVPLSLWMHNDAPHEDACAARALERFYHQLLPASLQGGQKRKRQPVPWNITSIILDASKRNHAPNNQAQQLSVTDCSVHEVDRDTATSLPFVVQPRLWSPDPLVQHTLLPLLLSISWSSSSIESPSSQHSDASNNNEARNHLVLEPNHQQQRERLIIWDLGAGAGRDACFLAEELRQATENNKHHCHLSYQVIAMDQRYRHLAVSLADKNDTVLSTRAQKEEKEHDEPCQLFFQRRGLTSYHATCRRIDLQNVPAVLQQIPKSTTSYGEDQANDNEGSTKIQSAPRLACILLVRYWNPSLMQALANSPLLTPGTLVALSHFGLASAEAEWNFPHPKPSHVLQYRQVNEMFLVLAKQKWKLLHEKTVLDGDRGRTLLQYVFQRI